jgi:hypothetical protein
MWLDSIRTAAAWIVEANESTARSEEVVVKKSIVESESLMK